MKKFTIVFSFLMIALLSFGQEYLLSDFEGNGAADRSGVWSYTYSGDTLTNPVTDGINPSANAVYAPAHYFMPSWAAGWYGTYGGMFILRGIDPTEYSNYTYLRFKLLVMQDNVTTGDSVKISLKFENKDDTSNDVVVNNVIGIEVTEGWGNEWVEYLVELPAEIMGVNLPDVAITLRNDNGEWAPGVDDIDCYLDDIALANGPTVGIDPSTTYSNGLAAYMIYDQLQIRMEASTNIDAIQVFDIKGSMVLNKVMSIAGSEFSIPMNLNDGVYIVRVKTDKQVLTKKFIK